jgi:outer membrane protein assembly factor BamB
VIRVVVSAGHRGRALGALAALVAGALLLGGCSSSKSDAPKPAPLAEFKPSLELRTAWRVSVGDAKGAPLQPAVLENAVYAAANNGTLMRVAPATGEVVWRVDTQARLTSGVGSDGFVVAVATGRGELLTFGADGKAGWRAQLPSDVLVTPLVGRGLVIVRSTDQRVSAFEADTGKRRWTYARSSPPLTLRTTSDMAFVGDNVVVGLPGGRMVALALSNGAARWETIVAEPRGATEVERLADVIGAIAVSGRDACAAAFQGRLTCVDNVNGNLRWARDHAAGGGVAMDARQVYSVDAKGAVVAHARESGASVWRNEALAHRRLSTPLALANAVLVGDFQGYVHALRPDSGEFAARTSLGGAITATPRPWGNGAIVQTQAGTLAFLSVER